MIGKMGTRLGCQRSEQAGQTKSVFTGMFGFCCPRYRRLSPLINRPRVAWGSQYGQKAGARL